MQEQVRQQHIPVKVYRTAERLMIAAPMAGREPENMLVEVTNAGRLMLHGDQRALLKEVKEQPLDEWSVGVYRRELALPVPVNAVWANVTDGNGVLMVALPISDQTSPARLTLERVTPTHGEHQGNAGHLAACAQTWSHELLFWPKRLPVLFTHFLTLCQYYEQKHMTTARNSQEVY